MKTLTVALLMTSWAFASDLTRGNHVDATVRDTSALYEDPEVCARVTEIGSKIVAASGNENGVQFRFYVLNNPDVTTFSAPNGSVYVTTGLLRHLRSEDELAAMLGHEVAHIEKRHLMNAERSERRRNIMEKALVVGIVAAGAFASAAVAVESAKAFTQTTAIIPGQMQTTTTAIRGPGNLISAQTVSVQQSQLLPDTSISQQLGNLSSQIVTWGTSTGGEALLNRYYMGFKDEYEFEADRLGMDYAARAGYDRAAMVQFMDRLSGTSEVSPAEMAPLHSTKKRLAERTTKAKEATPAEGKPK